MFENNASRGNQGGSGGNSGGGNGNGIEGLVYFYHPDHLGSSSYITDANGEVSQHLEYFAFGETFVEEHSNKDATPYLYNAKELDEETGLYYYGARYYSPEVSVWLSVDPKWEKVGAQRSPYEYTYSNPINLIDPDGNEPIKPYVGTAKTFKSLLDNSPSRVGTYKGLKASNYIRNLGKTKFNFKQMRPLPTQTGFFNKKKGRYIYTKKGGWIDMAHFLFYAGRANEYKQQKMKANDELNRKNGRSLSRSDVALIKLANMDPVGESLQDGYHQEMSDRFAAKHSAYSYEDLPSDYYGADFGANYFDPESDSTFGEQLQNYLNDLGATSPDQAPNFENLPTKDTSNPPTRTNKTTKPVYTDANP